MLTAGILKVTKNKRRPHTSTKTAKALKMHEELVVANASSAIRRIAFSHVTGRKSKYCSLTCISIHITKYCQMYLHLGQEMQ